MKAADYLSLAAVVFGVAAVLGATFAIFRSKQTQANLELLRAERDDLMSSNERLRLEQKEAAVRIEVLENERAVLRGVVTQEQAIKVLTGQLADHHTETMAAHKETLEVLERIAGMSNEGDDSQAIHRTQLELRKERADHHVRILTICVLAFLVALNLLVVGLQVYRSNTNARTLQLIEDATGEEAQARSRDTTASVVEIIDCKGRIRLQIALDRLQTFLDLLVAQGVVNPAAAATIGPASPVLCEPASTDQGD